MRVWTFSVVWNEAKMAPFWIRHYSPWVDRMVVWCEPSTDGTEEILRSCPKVEVRPWNHRGLDDEAFMQAVNHCYRGNQPADWVAFVDMDELLWCNDWPSLLNRQDISAIQATGYALISPNGWPEDDGHSQIYDLVKTGVAQWNYDKILLCRPRAMAHQTIGRHVYGRQWPKIQGCCLQGSNVKLFHCHHVGGIQHTVERNQRNYDRALNKKYAWNFAPGHNDNPAQVGSVAWVTDMISHNKLVNVV